LQPIEFPEANTIFESGGLPNVKAVVGFQGKEGAEDACVLCFEPSEEERAAIAAGAPVWLVMRGETLRPVRVQVESPFTGEMPPAQHARKKYIVFSCPQYYPAGGLDDIVYEADSLREVAAWLAEHPQDGPSVVDRDTWQDVELLQAEGDGARGWPLVREQEGA
jgi:hypothetical protein